MNERAIACPPDRRAAPARPGWLVVSRCVGLIVVLSGLCVLALGLAERAAGAGSAIAQAALGGGMAAAATALGTLPMLLYRRISPRAGDALLGFGAGIMLAASAFSLIIPALASARAQTANAWQAGGLVGAGIVVGALLLLAVDRWAAGLGSAGAASDQSSDAQRRAVHGAWLFVLAITLHNLPEGLAIGVAFGGVDAGTDAGRAQALATGISIQDLPEGLVVALALRRIGCGRGLSCLLGAASGLVEPVMAIAGAAAIAVAHSLLPWGLALAAGAMLYAVCHEAIPGAHREGNGTLATSSLMLGFVLMMLLDTALA